MRLTFRVSAELPPEVRAILARAPNRSTLVRDALLWYCSQGQALIRIEAALAGLAARLDRLEARLSTGPAPPHVPPPPPETQDLVARQRAALSAWCDD